MMDLCPIWGQAADLLPSAGFDGAVYQSKRAGGRYRISRHALMIIGEISADERARLTTWLVDQHDAGEVAPVILQQTIANAVSARPMKFSERFSRLLRRMRRTNWSFGDPLCALYNLSGSKITVEELLILCELTKENDAAPFLRALVGIGLFEERDHGIFYITGRGYEQMEALSLGGANTLRAFVAMWFSNETMAAFEEGIEPAIRLAGYTPIRIDRKEHNNKIDDEIIAEIRASRFVIADFTSGFIEGSAGRHLVPRGGVYYEAGFAQGLGTPVIWTVRADCIDHVHFDTRQFSHIVWSDPNDLKVRLYNRIAATLGTAPGAPKIDHA